MLALNAPEHGLHYKLNFEHRHGHQQSINRLEVKLPPWVTLEAYLKYLKEASSQSLEAGLTYKQVNLATGVHINRRHPDDGMDGQAFLRWGSGLEDQAKADFELRKLSPVSIHYGLTMGVTLPKSSPIKAVGTLELSTNVALVEVKCHQGGAKFDVKALLERTETGLK